MKPRFVHKRKVPDRPLLTCFPRPCTLAGAGQVFRRKGHCVVCVAEGAGQDVLNESKNVQTDASGNPILQVGAGGSQAHTSVLQANALAADRHMTQACTRQGWLDRQQKSWQGAWRISLGPGLRWRAARQ